jgi:hypothetical protein
MLIEALEAAHSRGAAHCDGDMVRPGSIEVCQVLVRRGLWRSYDGCEGPQPPNFGPMLVDATATDTTTDTFFNANGAEFLRRFCPPENRGLPLHRPAIRDRKINGASRAVGLPALSIAFFAPLILPRILQGGFGAREH